MRITRHRSSRDDAIPTCVNRRHMHTFTGVAQWSIANAVALEGQVLGLLGLSGFLQHRHYW